MSFSVSPNPKGILERKEHKPNLELRVTFQIWKIVKPSIHKSSLTNLWSTDKLYGNAVYYAVKDYINNQTRKSIIIE